MDQIQAMRIFVRIVELGNFSRAAEKLQLPRATVSHTLKRLEHRLGVRLFVRTTRQVNITAEGSLYYQRCLQLLSAFEEANSLFSHQRLQPEGKVRIDMPHSLARNVVIPALSDFYQRYPHITLILGANDTTIDLLREGVDCVLRAWLPHDEQLTARNIGQQPQITCASPAYLAKYGIPTSLDDLTGHQAVGYFSQLNSRDYPLEFVSQGKIESRILPSILSVSGADAYIAAGVAGLGLIQAPTPGIHRQLTQGELIEVLPDMPPPTMPLFIMFPPGRFLAPRVRVLIDWLIELFAHYPHESPDIKNRA
ncbi:LysR family regulatory protein [Yersinia frederiksenii]|uniref:LysR family regulatory protein n=2 Tax=Yersinia frederiksenii TaxID=29484 RepID=A0A380PXK8_YERFR|nr:LysR family transcriptional regulator [Yersinia frederiksenii]ATM97293.1 LysR family transcriptional regulator [Yersinia frederiksenii]EEQ13544.1 LysR-family regulatory protein [Yersinia frederiksenii ATCC 33641]KGA45465.1 bacterial regulatory helix-turn-helix, lysR family protein [Yersinia frederiksenii ATCC 33641]CFQ91542.1 LysR family regulatory protein [Yersinia frederiksenii]CNE84348.1 LysR family regulatory protein [Yersinia frederiksenii]